MTDDDLDRLQDAYVAAARIVRDAGVDFIDVKQCHRYLLSELLGAKNRPGKYGGRLENRTRMAREIFGRIRSDLGKDVILATRMNLFDGVPFRKNPETGIGEPVPLESPYLNAFGVNPENPVEPDTTETIEAIRLFREAGLQLLNVSAGCPYYSPHFLRPADTEPPDGYGAPESGLVGVERHFKLNDRN